MERLHDKQTQGTEARHRRGGRRKVMAAGAANTSKPLARLGVKACVIDGISCDE